MKPLKLYINDFLCHNKSYIDFSQFNSALIVGKVENNDEYSNGVGKTSIFKAIEYVLFNQADINLDKIIRDDTSFCNIVFDILIGDQEYRISRKRTRKGITDLTLLQRNPNIGSILEVYHNTNCEPVIDKNFWKDISGRRTVDTERELEKLIKTNFKSFRNTIHFMQNDFSGLTTSTPEKRKSLFKDSLNLIIYSKLEKIAKERASLILKEIEKYKVLIESCGDPQKELSSYQKQLSLLDEQLSVSSEKLIEPTNQLQTYNDRVSGLLFKHKELEGKYLSSLEKEKAITEEKLRLEQSIIEFKNKKAAISNLAKSFVEEIKVSKETVTSISEIDFSQIELLNDKTNSLKQRLTYLNVTIQNNILEYEKLKIPVPDKNECDHCRQTMTDEHREICKFTIINDMEKCQNNISCAKEEIVSINKELDDLHHKVNPLIYAKQQLELLHNKINSKTKELQDKKSMYNEYVLLIENFSCDLKIKKEQIEVIKNILNTSSLSEANSILEQIEKQRQNINEINLSLSNINKEIAHLNNIKAVIQHNIEQKIKDNSKLLSIKQSLFSLENKYVIYPKVLQAFSSTGIPNLIIQNVLDDLQLKANELLTQLKPGLQLSFFIEKVKTDGTEADTLDIHYYINNRERYYEQLSGAMKLAVTFSLKLGLSFLLQDMVGTNIKFLLLDEIDQSLDKASVDAFADIVKFFQKDFTILIITHNDRLKNKFSHAILVEQDSNMVSKAKVVNSW